MINFDNLYLVVLYFAFGLPGGIVRFIYLNILTIFKIKDIKIKDLWSKDSLVKIFLNPYNLLIGFLILIIVLALD